MQHQRLDVYLVKNKSIKTRSRAQEMIKNSFVLVNNKIITKPNELIKDSDIVEIKEEFKFVSRAGYKLDYALEIFKIDLNKKVVLDIGSSTGGFTDCCLQKGAKLVYSLDVGKDQLDIKLKNNPKVISLEETHLNKIPEINFENKIDVIVCDVSFISLRHVFKSIQKIINNQTKMIFLIKPQFELSKQILDLTNAKIKSEKLHKQAIDNVISYAKEYKIKLINCIESPILGSKSKNKEFLSYFELI